MDTAHGDNFGVMRSAGKMYIAQGDEKWIACNELSCLSGIGGILNAQAALAIGSAVGISKSAMLSALRRFTGLPHRFQSVGILAGVEWINDSKATNVAATIMALNNLNRPCIWIAGGDGKGADFSVLNSVVENKVSAAFLFGKDKQEIAAALHNSHIQLNLVDDLSAAMREARRYAHDGDCVLLSPACASLDMYTNYIERGNHFVEIFRVSPMLDWVNNKRWNSINIWVDPVMLLIVAALCIFGLVMVTSASMELAGRQYDNPWHFIQRQGVYLLSASLISLFVYTCACDLWLKYSFQLLLLSVFY